MVNKNMVNKDVSIFVGAGHGLFLVPYAENNKDVIAIGFEPNPYSFVQLFENTKHLDNVILVPKAVSYVNSDVTFNITKLPDGDLGCSSLLEYSDNIDNLINDGMEHSEVVDTKCIRIDTFLDDLDFNVNSIKNIVVDAQGYDYECLISTGRYSDLIEVGEVEVVTYENALYQNQENVIWNVVRWLYEKGFVIYNITNNDNVNLGTEMNVFFKKI
jgi:FkbM family methyltransferase